MKIKYLFLFVCLFSVFGSSAARAETFELGFLSPQDIIKLSQPIDFKLGDSSYKATIADVSAWLKQTDSLSYDPGYSSEIENTRFCKYRKSMLCDLSFDIKRESHIRKKTLVELDSAAVSEFVSNLAFKTDKEAENARFKLENGKASAFSMGEEGIKIKEDEVTKSIVEYVRNRTSDLDGTQEAISLAYDKIKPEVPIQSIDSMGIDTLLGEGRSNFRGSPRNRIANIKVATARFDGVMIKPGDEFSFVSILGPVDEEHGYYPELVIKKDKTEPEFGGGICQVSTTVFRAAIYSGLEITARRNHAYPVSYYSPQGMDSTVYIPKPDLKFKNNTPGYILVQTKFEGTELIFDFYGTSDGRQTNVIGPKILERNPDGSMKTTFTQEVTDKDGNVIQKDVFNSSYESPSKFPHPAPDGVLTEKPKGWSDREWKKYKAEHNLP
ncbi:MAG: hypothetical protein HGB08_03195 [Candidatus Moranbacteria bacterium]|nr:hypothetical protein [Candidatus Moranbacteria bacterium]